MKVVINSEFGGFGLSDKAVEYYHKLQGKPIYKHKAEGDLEYYGSFFTTITPGEYKELEEVIEDSTAPPETREAAQKLQYAVWFSSRDISRTDPYLIQVVEVLGSEANGFAACLKVIEIPDGIEWEICEYDGCEWVAEKHRTWR